MFRHPISFLILVALIAVAAFGGWHFGRQNPSSSYTSSSAAAGRKVLFYQSPMHPWIKSDQPGNCTICGMKLVPVYEGDATVDSASDTAIHLSAQSATVTNLETAVVARQPIKRLIRVAGQIDDDDSAHRRLSAYVEARIEKLYVNYVGAEVTAGQPLAALYSKDLLVSRGEYTLALKQPPSPQRDATIAASKAKLRRMGLTPEQVEAFPGQNGDTFEIVAPISGTVVERKVYEGQYVKEGDVLFEIGDFSKMWFVFDAYERDLAWVRVGQKVEVTTPSVPGKVFTAPIAFIDPNLTPQTRAAKVRVVLENPMATEPGKHRHELLHKVYAEGRIQVATEPLLTVPRSAVLSPGGDAMVYVVKDERVYEPRRVTLGRAGDDVWEVLGGLAEGDRVVTTGNLLIDAQAQLAHPTEAPASSPRLTLQTEEQRVLADKLFLAAASVGEALAADNLDAHNKTIPALHEAAMGLGNALGADGQRLSSVAHVGPAADLTAARKQFYPLSMIVAELVLQAKPVAEGAGPIVRVYECPMAKSAVPSAETNQGRWVQSHAPLRNPFFGAEMLDCGKEVKP